MTNFSDIRQRGSQQAGYRKSVTIVASSKQQQSPLIPPAAIRAPANGGSDATTAAANNRRHHQAPVNNLNSSSRTAARQTPSKNRAPQPPPPPATMMNSNSSKMAAGSQLEPEPEVWNSIEDLFWDHMEEVQNKWDTLKLNDDIWAKLIYFEQNRRLAKAYVSAPVLTIDGSTNGLDGFRIGLSGIDNTYRNLDSVGCLRSIGQGVKLKIDNQGNILIRKISQQQNSAAGLQSKSCSVWIRDWPNSSASFKATTLATTSNNSVLANIDENCTMREIAQSDTSYKLFDMRRFRHYLERRRRMNGGGGGNEANTFDWRQCVSIISFVRGKQQLVEQPDEILEDPCWIMLINIIAIDMIKSIICDDRKFHTGQMKSSTLAHQHSLLNSKPHDENEMGRSRTLKSSSSTSVLYQPTPADLSLNEAEISVGVANNRVKKPRTAQNARGARPSSLARDNSHHRRYQSSQHLSNSNIIYTTFNSKFITNQSRTPRSDHHLRHHQVGDTSTSDYYSGSRSSTNGFNGSLNKPATSVYSASRVQGYMKSNRFATNQQQQAGAPFARGQFVRHLENNRSQSSSDLSLQKFDFKPIQSAIKMNYDHFSESEDFDEQEDAAGSFNHEIGADEKQTNGSSSLVADSCRSSSNEQSDPSCIVNHNECQAMHNSVAVSDVVGAPPPSQKMSRSSLTSSSSSGCADNDYFMSHSSSSVSSSSTSNDREMSSQPASSSGIACSGNTSDEYDDNRKQPNSPVDGPDEACALTRLHGRHHKLNGAAKVDTKKVTSSKRQDQLETTKANRRGYKIKTIESEAGFVDESQDCGIECDCEPAAYDCDCCCDCPIGDHTLMEPLDCCNCETESIYDCLSAPPRSIAASRGKHAANRRKLAQDELKVKTENEISTSDEGSLMQKKSPARSDHSEKESNPLESTKSPGWLEKRKYSRIFPKFIFSSSNSGSRRIGIVSDSKTSSTQGKSQTLERAEKFRLTRSTQDLT